MINCVVSLCWLMMDGGFEQEEVCLLLCMFNWFGVLQIDVYCDVFVVIMFVNVSVLYNCFFDVVGCWLWMFCYQL